MGLVDPGPYDPSQSTVSVNVSQLGGTALSGANVVDTTNTAIRVNAVTGKIDHNVTGLNTGRKTVSTAGTRETLAASTTAKRVIITAETDNTGLVVVGGTAVVAALATRQGTPLYAGDSVELDVDNLNDVNLDVTVSGDGVTFTYLT